MANAKRAANLKANADRSTEELKAMGAKGGRASGEARRRRRNTRELVKYVLNMDVVTNRKVKNALKKLGYDVETEGAPSVELIMQIAIANQAMSGDLASARFLYDYAQVPDIKTAIERERIKAIREGKAKVELNVNTAEEAGIMEEIARRMKAEGTTSSVSAGALPPSHEGEGKGNEGTGAEETGETT